MASRRATGGAGARPETEGRVGGDATPPSPLRQMHGSDASAISWHPGDGRDGFPSCSPLGQAMASNGSDGNEDASVSDPHHSTDVTVTPPGTHRHTPMTR